MTLATFFRGLMALQLAGGGLLTWALLPEGSPRWLIVAGAVAFPVGATLLLLAIEIAVGAIIDPPSPRRGPLRVMRLWLSETWTWLVLFGWRQPYRAGFAEPAIATDPERPAVLLVHGYMCNRAVWKPLLASGVLRDANVATVNLEPIFGDIEAYAEVIAAAVQRLRDQSGARRVTLVCHSMGGLAARCYLRRFGSDEVERAITLCTPHHGTVFGHIGIGRNARQMATGSRFLQQLGASESPELRARFECVASADDNLIVPRSSPLLPGARQHVLAGAGHLAMLDDERVWALVGAAVRAEAGTAR
jgi:pimeloyl-ACP methyl ester carboxylesterase